MECGGGCELDELNIGTRMRRVGRMKRGFFCYAKFWIAAT